LPAGWRVVSEPASQECCLDRIDDLWIDMRPAGLKHTQGEPGFAERTEQIFLRVISKEELACEMNSDGNYVFCWEFVEYIGAMPNNFCGPRILCMRCPCIEH